MKNLARRCVFLIGALAFAGAALAQPRTAQRQYDPKAETTIQGTVEEVTAGPSAMRGVVLRVKTDEKDVMVHLGPAEFVEQNKIKFAAGDTVKVVGTPARDREGIFLARQIEKGDAKLVLRDERGLPLWARSRQR